METNIKPNPTLMNLLFSIRSTQATIQTFINENENLSPKDIDSSIIDLAEHMNDVQNYLLEVSCTISDCIGPLSLAI